MEVSWWQRILLLRPLYLYLVPAVLFAFRWVMPWYLFWFGALIFLFETDEQSVGYLKQITIVGFVYTLGVVANWPYFVLGPLPDFLNNFPLGLNSFIPLAVMIIASTIIFGVWRWSFNRQETKMIRMRLAEERGELFL